MTTRKIQDALPIHRPATTPTDFTGLDNPCIVQPQDEPQRGIVVLNGQPYLISNASNQVINNVLGDGTFLRTIDGGTTPIFAKVTSTKARIRFATYRMASTGLVLASAIVNVSLRGANLTTTTGPLIIAYTSCSGSLAMSDIGAGVGAGAGQFVSGTGGSEGLFDATVTFGATTGVKTLLLQLGPDQFELAVDIT